VRAYQAVIGAVPKPAVEDYTDRIGSGDVWIAEIGHEPCGVLVLERGRDFLMIYSVAVDPCYQGKGIGKALLAHAEKCAVEAGLPEIRLYTNERMEPNAALYRRCGFAEIGKRPHPTRKNEVLIDMAKLTGG
jgi:ribosomal protein S18 acetylase RimI-like enzyme